MEIFSARFWAEISIEDVEESVDSRPDFVRPHQAAVPFGDVQATFLDAGAFPSD
jgi:hypothetical protein